MLIDTHAHLIDRKFSQDLEEVLKRGEEAGVGIVINVGFTLGLARKAVALAGVYPSLYATVGIHPHDASEVPLGYLAELERLAQNPKVVALGEMGLDFYRNISPPAVQEIIFREQLALARKIKLPVIIHDRDAHVRVMEILKEERAREVGGVLHCFSGDLVMARECIREGFYISIAGPITFKKATMLREVVKNCPLDRLLLETDCPYLAPEPFRGKRSEPAHVALICQAVAAVREEPLAEIARQTTANAVKLFGIKEDKRLKE